MGVSEEQIAAAMRTAPEEPFGVWDDNWDAWLVFMSLADRWTMVSDMRGTRRTGGPAHTEIESSLRLLCLPRRAWRQHFEDLKEMIWAVLEVDRQQ